VIEIFTTPEGLTLSYERHGSGPRLVCHPGGPGGSAAEFLDAGPVCADAISRELANGRLVTIPDSGHFVYVEQPEAVRAALTDFLL
jgi:pimeloyl-ACP methyl ester carboxylesterase